MLPQFPNLQLDLSERLREFTAVRKNQLLGGLGTVPSHHVFEGHTNAITRADGGYQETEMMTASAELSIGFDEFPKLTLQGLMEKFESIAQQLAKAQAQAMFASITEATTAAGNSIDAEGQKFSADLYLKVLQKLAVDFRPDGTPNIPSLHINPAMEETVKSVLDSLQTDPILKKRFNQIIEQKFGEWRAEEASRELAG